MLDLWDQFVFLLKQADETVSDALPSMALTLNNNFQSLAQELADTVSGATSGVYLDPNQNAAQVVSKLKAICRQLNVTSVRLKELSRTSKALRGKLPLPFRRLCQLSEFFYTPTHTLFFFFSFYIYDLFRGTNGFDLC